jgi:hypothetical protein
MAAAGLGRAVHSAGAGLAIPGLACAPLAVLTYEGRGYNGTALTAPGAALAPEIASGFPRRPRRPHGLRPRPSPREAPAGAGGAVAATGEGAPVLIAAITLMVLLACAWRRPPARPVRAAAALTMAALAAITGIRAEQGRSLYYSDIIAAFGPEASPNNGIGSTRRLL